jgi:phenylalanyl-tRNA synthetase beta chain
MIGTMHWLKEWVDITTPAQELAHLLTMAGLEVDSITDPVPAFSRVVVGLVSDIQQHPNADKLRVCTVDVGGTQPLSIVCGAKNVDRGMKVPVVIAGGELPGGMKIKETELRGVLSQGMICSVSELGLAETSDGILELPDDAPIGEDFKTYCGFPDIAFEIGLTPNRGDCLSIWGLAREIAVLTGGQHKPFKATHIPYQGDYTLEVDMKAPEACSRYVGRVIRGVNAKAKTPFFMVERLRRCGMRSIAPLIDITNYVMWLTGQPMHAFDADKIKGSVTVRMAREQEKLVLLDNTEVTLNPTHLVIADEEGAIALAGIMGGKRTMISDTTQNIFLEAAHFKMLAMAGKARGLGLHTDGSHRWERGVDPILPEIAMSMATEWVLRITGGSCGPLVTLGSPVAASSPIVFNPELIQKTLGIAVPLERVTSILSALGCVCELQSNQHILVQPPSHRFDLQLPIDLVEEVARVVGYDNITATALVAPLALRHTPEKMFSLARAQQILVAQGYHEAINYSFIAEKDHEIFFPGEAGYKLANPLSSDLSVMRKSLMPGLVKALAYNQNRQAQRARLFEAGRCFTPKDGGGCNEHEHLAGVVFGNLFPLNWKDSTEAHFYHVKAEVEQILSTLGQKQITYTVGPEVSAPAKLWDPEYLHPGKSAVIRLDGEPVGTIGVLHPSIVKAYKLKGQPIVFELNLDSLKSLGVLPTLHELPKFPSVKRDLALVVDQACVYESLRSVIHEELGALVQSADLFDLYEGEGLPKGKKSFALSLILQDLSHTLKEDELNATIERLLSRLHRDVGATLRE